jgi:hypothetical protein
MTITGIWPFFVPAFGPYHLQCHKNQKTADQYRCVADGSRLYFCCGWNGVKRALAGGVAIIANCTTYVCLTPYAFMSKDFTTGYTLAGFLMVGAFAHGAIFFVRDYDQN